MSTPLMILGPGGDFTTRFEPAGRQMLSRVGSPQGHPEGGDSESAGSFAGYSRPRKRDQEHDDDQPHVQRVLLPGAGADAFEHQEPLAPPSPATQRWVKAGSLAAAASAIDAWLAQQTQALAEASFKLLALRSIQTPPPGVIAPTRGGRWSECQEDSGRDRLLRNPATSRITRDILGDDADLATDPPEAAETPFQPTSLETEPRYAQAHPQAAEDPADDPRLSAHARLFPEFAGDGRRAERQQGHRLRARRGADQEGGPAARPQQGSLFGVGR